MNNLIKPLAKSVSVSLWLTAAAAAAAAAANAAIQEVPWGIWFIDKRH